MISLRLTGSAHPTDEIYRQLRGHIKTGQVIAGERLPTVRQLARDLGLAAGTVARAYKQLADDGLVTTRARGGTVVNSSANDLDPAVLRAARDFCAEAERHSIGLDDALDAVKAMWPRA